MTLFASEPFLRVIESLRRAVPSDVRIFRLPHPFGTAEPGDLDALALAVVDAHAEELADLLGGER